MFISVLKSDQLKIKPDRFILSLFLLAMEFFLGGEIALAHPGGVDKYGGHTSSETGKYHCHTEKCKRAQAQVESATQDADRENFND